MLPNVSTNNTLYNFINSIQNTLLSLLQTITSNRFMILEQEKYGLRRKLETLEGDYDGRLSELQTDLKCVRQELESQQQYTKQIESEKNKIIQELIEQNHRLTNELKQSTETESLLENQLQTLRDQFNVRRTNLNDHIDQLEGLREEINLLSKRKGDLERKISSLTQDREHLNVSLEESSDRIFLLEKQLQQQELELRTQHKDLDELRHANTQLQNKMDVLSRKTVPSDHYLNGHHSLFNEIEMSSQSSNDEDLRSLNGRIDDNEDEIYCDERDSSYSSSQSDSSKLRQELVEVYQLLRQTYHDLHRKKDNSGNFNSTQDSGIPDEQPIHQIKSGMFKTIVRDLISILNDLNSDFTEMVCLSCQTIANDRCELERLRKEAKEQSEQLKKSLDQITEMTKRLTIQESELNAIKEEKEILKCDINNSNGLAKDEIVKRAWEVRDQAVKRKNNVEVELAKTRIEVMHINSQLLETIQQKIELSQQLEQWQVDMQILLDEQLKSKLTSQESGDKRRNGDTNGMNGTAITNNKTVMSRGNKLLRLLRYNN
ncbi:bicaudal D-related protein homolog isoform X2 [Oppia nitens]|uniref:bicaudal D-related protein homolog isoform X2 n=1 Tax=Oppia nitens TaxID=1686743 RepID=UPI0023DBD32F|nr:bicaudal D-related protein homolog isoform X2 [Oppia nitens]